MNAEIHRYENPDHLAHEVASLWLRELGQKPPRKLCCVAFSGGRIARNFFLAAAQLLKTQKNLLSDVHFFWADERCVPLDDPESNYLLCWENFLKPLEIPQERIHAIRGDQEPAIAAFGAAESLCQFASRNHLDVPVLNYAFLGMGENGHIASLFPEAPPAVETSAAIYYPVTTTKPPFNRITLTYKVLKYAEKAWVLASGTGKEEALRASLASSGGTPLAKLIHVRARTQIFTDIVPS